MYAFAISLQDRSVIKATGFSFIVGLLTLALNLHWIAPNVYYTLAHSQYVQDSRENQLFAPESIASISEASTYQNFIRNTHYLFTWKDYSIADREFQFIFDEWLPHLSQLDVNFWLSNLGRLTLLGFILTLAAQEKGNKRWAVLSFYLFAVIFIWQSLFPTQKIFDWFYQSRTFQETFRNAFTKLSILYTFTSVLLFTQVFEVLVMWLRNKKLGLLSGRTLSGTILLFAAGTIIYTAWPSFSGHFLNENLKVQFPAEYKQLFNYLNSRSHHLRTLQLPQYSHVGWEYYDWSFIKPGNGYQGMGFYFFGMPQPLLNRDTDRWVESSDYFIHELEHALDIQDVDLFQRVLAKYEVDLIIIDETKIKAESKAAYDYQRDHQFVSKAGLKQVWRQNFLTVYERTDEQSENALLIPDQLTLTTTTADRLRVDHQYLDYGDYLTVDRQRIERIGDANQNKHNVVQYPFADLYAKFTQVEIDKNKTVVSRSLPAGAYTGFLSNSITDGNLITPAQVTYQENLIKIEFPQVTIESVAHRYQLPHLENQQFFIEESGAAIVLFIGDTGVVLDPNSVAQPVLKLSVNDPVEISYIIKPSTLNYSSAGKLLLHESNLVELSTMQPNWQLISQEFQFATGQTDQLKITSSFPTTQLNLPLRDSSNCSVPKRGTTQTSTESGQVKYQADQYGVNCSGYELDYHSTAFSYLMRVVGKNVEGRGLKFFVNYDDEEIIPEDYIFTKPEFDEVVVLQANSTDSRDRFFLNWETRSFGKPSIAELENIYLAAFPVDQISGLRLVPLTAENNLTFANQLQINSHLKIGTLRFASYHCQSSDSCYLGFDESYDDMWLALDLDTLQLMPHFRLNSWANAWQVNDSGRLIIIYLPQLISSLSILSLMIAVPILVKKHYTKTSDE